MATVKNVSGDSIRLFRPARRWMGQAGVNLPLADQETGTIPDDFVPSDEIQALLTATDIEILGYNPNDAVIAGEVNTTASVYSITLDNTPGDISASNTAATKAGGAETYDFSDPADRNISFVIDGTTVDYTFLPGDFSDIGAGTAAEVEAALDGVAAFAAIADAVDNAGTIEIYTLSLGTSAALAISGSAATVLGLTTTTVNGTTAPSDVEVLVKDASNRPVPNAEVILQIYDAATAGALLADTQVQLPSKGTIPTGVLTNDAIGYTDANGELDFEIVSDISGADSLFLELGVPSGYFLSITDRKGSDSSREQIDKTS